MDVKKLLSACDHTLLRQDAVWTEIKDLIDDAIRYQTASVCIPPSFVKEAAAYSAGRMPICTVIGFPNGYQKTSVKVFETREAVADGASEIDMVINIGWVKAGREKELREEISAVRDACPGKILKVIVETCMLTEEEKILMCGIVTESGADFIKTSTGFAGGGATFRDVDLFRKHVGRDVKIKAAGGIASLEDAERFLALGASRLGTSRIVKLVKESGAFHGGEVEGK
ncbi:MAG: deoxyribose-phosphate aldolase [Clostridium sp.]|nr:deoxyribose-phosphate aldolase [Clostridium sp.]